MTISECLPRTNEPLTLAASWVLLKNHPQIMNYIDYMHRNEVKHAMQFNFAMAKNSPDQFMKVFGDWGTQVFPRIFKEFRKYAEAYERTERFAKLAGGLSEPVPAPARRHKNIQSRKHRRNRKPVAVDHGARVKAEHGDPGSTSNPETTQPQGVLYKASEVGSEESDF